MVLNKLLFMNLHDAHVGSASGDGLAVGDKEQLMP
jgi:hypothetical protein